jgi:signal transduction histidine kinase
MKQENLKKLFSIFGKIKDTLGINKQGVGLGLSICKKICEQMKGFINVTSEEN